MAAIYDRFMKSAEEACLDAWRAELLGPVEGRVLEIGAGTGANLRHYAPKLERLVLTEPDRHMLAKLEPRARRERPNVELREARANALPFEDRSFDVVVSTLVLCSVEDVEGTLREAKRVLAPGGTLVFLEHVAAEENPSRFVWQRRVEPLWKPLAGNCHLTRRTGAAIRSAGFAIEREERESMRKAMPLVRSSIRGSARKPLEA